LAKNRKEHKSKYQVNMRIILGLLIGLGFFTLILLTTMLSASQNNRFPAGSGAKTMQQDDQAAASTDSSGSAVLAVVKEIDPDNETITLYDINTQIPLVLSYTGGTNITDKYGQVIAMSQIEIGSMVDAAYLKDKNKLMDMNISTKAWTYADVSNLSIDQAAHTMKIASTLYKYVDDITILDGQEFITADQLREQDMLTVQGFDQTIWSITVTRGHGTVILQDYEDFLGDFITIGYESMQQITEDMEITVREGEFNLTVENGDYSATKRIRINRNKATYVSLSDLGPEAPKHSQITFDITPFGADLSIDGDLTSYANPIELLYGKHNIKVSLGGYTSYEGTLDINSAGKTIRIDLPESSSEEEAAISETDTNTNTPATNTGTGADTETAPDTGTTSDTGTVDSDTAQDSSGDTSQDEEITDEDHLIYVQNPVGASVYIDGEYKCTSPGSFTKMIGSHVITFIEDGFETMSYTVEVSDDGKDTYFTFPALVPKPKTKN
jgi:hypothetical protein